jgi:hypothetical protein
MLFIVVPAAVVLDAVAAASVAADLATPTAAVTTL